MAGITFQTSFDHYTTVTHRFNSLAGTSPLGTIVTAAGRNSTKALRFTNAVAQGRAVKTLPAPITDIYFAFAYRTSVLPAAALPRVIAEIRDAGVRQVGMILQSDGTLIFRSGGSGSTDGVVLGTAIDFAALANVFYHIEWYVRISTSVGLLQVRVNEVEKLNLTGLDTQQTANNVVTEICLVAVDGTNATVNMDFDDVVVRDDDWNGDVEVLALLPTGIGATNNWTATGAATTREAVDEAAPNSDTDYMETATVNDLSLFTYPTIPITSEIRAVVPIPFAKKTDAGTAKIKSTVRHSGVNYDGAEKAPSDASYEYHPDILMVNPGTATAFTPADWNAIEVGVKRTA